MGRAARVLTHADGRRWYGRSFPEAFEFAIIVPDEEPILRRRRSREPATLLEQAIAELDSEGFASQGWAAWPIAEPRAGSLVVCSAADFSDEWILAATEYRAPRRHGAAYPQRLIAIETGAAIACVYDIQGYRSRDECAAFERAAFLTDNFQAAFVNGAAPPAFVVIVDVGYEDDGTLALVAANERLEAVADVDQALASVGTSLFDLRLARERAGSAGRVVWQLARQSTP